MDASNNNFNEVNAFLKDNSFKRLMGYFDNDNLSELIKILIDKAKKIEVGGNNEKLSKYNHELQQQLENLLQQFENLSKKQFENLSPDGSSPNQYGGSENAINHKLRLYDWTPKEKIFGKHTFEVGSMIENFFLRSTPDKRRNIYSF